MPAITLSHGTTAETTTILNKERSRTIFAAFNATQHWALIVFLPNGTTLAYDSAPSLPMSEAIRKMCSRIGRTEPRFAPSPKRIRGSEECGIFVIANALAYMWGITLPERVISPNRLRAVLVNSDTM
jgi:hypothetical protein